MVPHDVTPAKLTQRQTTQVRAVHEIMWSSVEMEALAFGVVPMSVAKAKIEAQVSILIFINIPLLSLIALSRGILLLPISFVNAKVCDGALKTSCVDAV